MIQLPSSLLSSLFPHVVPLPLAVVTACFHPNHSGCEVFFMPIVPLSLHLHIVSVLVAPCFHPMSSCSWWQLGVLWWWWLPSSSPSLSCNGGCSVIPVCVGVPAPIHCHCHCRCPLSIPPCCRVVILPAPCGLVLIAPVSTLQAVACGGGCGCSGGTLSSCPVLVLLLSSALATVAWNAELSLLSCSLLLFFCPFPVPIVPGPSLHPASSGSQG